MEEHYIKDVGKITYVYGVNLEEHKTVIEKQQKRIAELEKQLDQLKQQLEEKDKEIEELKLKLDIRAMNLQNINTERMEAVRNQTQLAIQELEKVKIMAGDLLEKFCSSWEYHQKYMRGHRHIEYYDLIQGIDNRIKELKGEKEVED